MIPSCEVEEAEVNRNLLVDLVSHLSFKQEHKPDLGASPAALG